MGKLPTRQKMKRRLTILAFCFLLVGIGYSGLKLLLSEVTELDKTSSIGEISDIILSYLSIFVTIILGIVVYWQAERINKLETGQYDVFLGAEKLDFTTSIGTQLLLLNRTNLQSKIKLFETMVNNRIGLLANISLQEGNEGLQFPFLFITRNVPLITSVCVRQIDVKIQHYSDSQKSDLIKKFPIDANPVCRFLPDKSEFTVCLSVNGIEKQHIEKVKIKIYFEVEDQLKRTHSIEAEMDVEQINGNLCMISSRSNT